MPLARSARSSQHLRLVQCNLQTSCLQEIDVHGSRVHLRHFLLSYRSARPATRFASPAPLAGLIEDVAEATASESPATSAGAVRHAAILSRRRWESHFTCGVRYQHTAPHDYELALGTVRTTQKYDSFTGLAPVAWLTLTACPAMLQHAGVSVCAAWLGVPAQSLRGCVGGGRRNQPHWRAGGPGQPLQQRHPCAGKPPSLQQLRLGVA